MGTFATAKASLLEPKHRKFIDCDVNSDCIAKMMPCLLHVFAEQVLHPELDVTESKKVQKASTLYLVVHNARSMAHMQIVWTVSRGLYPAQVFPEHIAMFFGQYHMNMNIFENTRHLSCTQCSEKWLTLPSSMDQKILLAHEYCVYDLSIKISLIKHPSSYIWCRASQTFTKSETIGYYYGTLIYKNINAHENRNYGEGAMTVSPSFREYNIQLKTKVRCSYLRGHTAWIILAKFDSFRIVKSLRSLPRKPIPSDAPNLQRREANITFEEKSGVVSRSDYAWYDLIWNSGTTNDC